MPHGGTGLLARGLSGVKRILQSKAIAAIGLYAAVASCSSTLQPVLDAGASVAAIQSR